tara:strand:+ start:256 stop:585 length:330 start_codon:yes stop_codon:yes gene_type:complete
MDILRKNTTPAFQIVPRRAIGPSEILRIILRNESSDVEQSIACAINKLPNDNYTLTLFTFPVGKLGARFSYSLLINGTNEVLSLGKLMIISATQSVQDYTTKINTNFYL